MPVIIGGIPEIELSYSLFVGKVRRDEALAFPGRIATSDLRVGSRWINVLDGAADLSDLDAECLLEMKKRLAPVISEAKGGGSFTAVLVSNSRYNDPLANVWRVLAITDPSYPSDPLTASSIFDACIAHGLDEAAARNVEARLTREIVETGGG